MVSPPTCTGRPASRWYMADKDFDSTPTTSISGRSARAAIAMPAMEAAAADRHHEAIESGRSSKHLQRHRALAGDHRLVVVGVHEHQFFPVGEVVREGGRVGQRVALEPQVGAEHLGAAHLGVRRALGHHDDGADAQPRRVVRDALRVVARAHRDHAAARWLSARPEKLVERAALLERGGELQVLELEADLGAGQGRERAAVEQGGADDAPAMRPAAARMSWRLGMREG